MAKLAGKATIIRLVSFCSFYSRSQRMAGKVFKQSSSEGAFNRGGIVGKKSALRNEVKVRRGNCLKQNSSEGAFNRDGIVEKKSALRN
ncbi:hypothetical protein CDAR_550101 [Caerostris darwini]|uniref:Uncharacterized protein n=1 Tax=Caerostris darwini TaxID=1538125 RepID=A0AAV4PKE8_9ARAC|nr:hypothetical protein CDAR_550101 [Caerostris darwini]